MSDLTDVGALRELREDERLAELNEHVLSISLFRTFPLERDEVQHPRLSAMLLDSRHHRGARSCCALCSTTS